MAPNCLSLYNIFLRMSIESFKKFRKTHPNSRIIQPTVYFVICFRQKSPWIFLPFAILNFVSCKFQISKIGFRLNCNKTRLAFWCFCESELQKHQTAFFPPRLTPKPVFTLSVFLHFMQSERIEFSRNDFL